MGYKRGKRIDCKKVQASIRQATRLATTCLAWFFNAAASRIEMYLEARCTLTARWPDGAGECVRHFAAGERIHTENSCKYSPEGFTALLASAGFGEIRIWTDPRQWFALFFARPTKQ